MFDKKVYILRREALRKKCKNGLLIFPGNGESPMNYASNTYHFRQDSNFLYFFGLDKPGLAAIIDIDENLEIIYGDNACIDDIIWMGESEPLSEGALKVGIEDTRPLNALKNDIQQALKQGRQVGILPTYRVQQEIFIADLLNITLDKVKDYVFEDYIKAVISLREKKDENEIRHIEHAVDVAYKMHTTVMRMAFQGTWEREIAGEIEGIALSHGGPVSFPVILSVEGQTLHNHYHGNLLSEGKMVVADAGCESPLHYASDITRTTPVGGKFNQKQKDIYQIVLEANMKVIEAIKPGEYNMDLHFLASRCIVEGLKSLGLMHGDTEEAVRQGAHTLFFPHGIGHMLGLDVHDMESLGEDYVGYDETIKRRSQFGTSFLRLAKKLKPGFVITVEPGIYFIPTLIDIWKTEKKAAEFLNYSKIESYRNFGGIRIEDDVLVTQDSCRVLGKPIPKTVEEIENLMKE